MFTIICIGRIDFLLAVLNGLAMITGENSPSGFYAMISLGLLCGVLIVLFRGVVYQKLELQWVLVGWLLFEVMFVPKVSVVVEDIYTGNTQTVANVPLGPAAIGSLTSTVGISLANAFGTAFSYPSMTTNGYMDSLTLINSIRDMDYGGANDGDPAANVPNVDYQRSIRGYLKDCVLYSISMQLPSSLTWEKLRESSNLLQDINVASGTWFTTLYIDGSQSGQTLTCTDAYNALSQGIQSKFLPAWEAYIGSKLGLTDTQTAMQGALDSLLGGGRDAQTFMINAVIKKELELADLGFQEEVNNEAGIAMRVQAMEQRRTAWASEQSLWGEMARPAIAFIEGFFYAASPFAAFMFCLGAVGISLFGRYLLLALWIQLWTPVLAIANLYLQVAAANNLQKIAAAGTDPISLVGLDSLWTDTASYLALGGMMMAATPLLSLILITGSYFALTGLSNRISGGDHVDPRIQSPDLVGPAPVASTGAMASQSALYTHDPSFGLHATGSEQLAPKIDLGHSLSNTIQSRASHVQEISERLVREMFSGVDVSRKDGVEGFISSYQGQSQRSSSTESDRVLQGLAQSVVNDQSRYKELSTTDAAALSGAVALGLMGAGSGGQVRDALQNVQGASDGERKAWALRIDQLGRREVGHGAELARAIVHDEQQGSHSQLSRALGNQYGTRWADAMASVISAQKSFDEAAGLSQSLDLHQTLPALAYGHVAEQTGTTQELLNMVSAHHLDRMKVSEIAGTFIRRKWSPNRQHALAAAAAVVLNSGGEDSAMDLIRYSAKHFGSLDEELRNPRESSTSLQPIDTALSEARAAEIKEHVVSEVPDSSALSKQVDDGLQIFGEAGSDALRQRGEKAVQEFFRASKDADQYFADKAMADLDKVAAIEQGNAVDSTWQDTRGLLRYLQEQKLLHQLTSTTGENFTHSLETAASRGHSRYEEVLAKTHNKALATAAGLAAGASGLVDGWNNFQADKYNDALRYARSQGLPEPAAKFFATESKLPYGSVPEMVKAESGLDPEVNQLEADVKQVVGDRGVEALKRAAVAPEMQRDRYLHDALTLYRRQEAIAGH